MFWFFEKLAILGSDFDLKFDLTLAPGSSLFNRLRTKCDRLSRAQYLKKKILGVSVLAIECKH